MRIICEEVYFAWQPQIKINWRGEVLMLILSQVRVKVRFMEGRGPPQDKSPLQQLEIVTPPNLFFSKLRRNFCEAQHGKAANKELFNFSTLSTPVNTFQCYMIAINIILLSCINKQNLQLHILIMILNISIICNRLINTKECINQFIKKIYI